MTANEDFLFAQEAIAQGFVTEAQVEEGLLLQKRMADDLKLDERLGVILVKRGYLAEDQARRVHARIEPEKTGEIRGYKLLSVIGRGAMGTVYRALNVGLNREVAIKVLRPDLAGDRTQIERLKAEAKMLADLDHPNVIRALDAGESNGFPFVVMEYVEGETLRDRLRREGPLPESEALRITRAIADALERARRMGIVHRDVKPGNILLSRNGTPKLMDLGLAKGPIDLGLTQHGATVGTPQYISPEQAVDPKKADTRSDIYSLGATLYAMLTGKPPFDGQTLAEILTKVLYETPMPVRTLRPEVSPEAGYLVERMMLRDPGLRYRTPLAVVEDIDRLQQGTSILPAGFSGNWEAYLLRQRSRRWLSIGSKTVAAAVVVAVAARLLTGWMESNETRTAQAGRIDRTLDETRVQPGDDRLAVERKRTHVLRLLRDLGGAEPKNRHDLEARKNDLEQTAIRFQDLDQLLRRDVDPAVEARNFVGAERALVEFLEKHPGYEPVRRAALARLESVRKASDDALRAARAEWEARVPETFEDVVRLAVEWMDLTAGRFAETPFAREVRLAAHEDASTAQGLGLVVARGADDVAPERMRDLIARAAFDEAGKRLADRRQAVGDEWDRRKARLARLEAVFGERRLSDLAMAPFVDAEQTANRLAQEAADRAVEEARALVRDRRFAEAGDRLAAFSKSAAGAFPQAAEIVREQADSVETDAQKARVAADERWRILLSAIVGALKAQDPERAQSTIDQAKASKEFDPFPPLFGQFAGLTREVEAYRAFWTRVFDGLERHTGSAPAKWLDPVEMADGTAYRKWEVLSVDRAERKIVIRSHSGGTDKIQPDTWDVPLFSRDQLTRLAGLDPDANPADAFSLAMFERAGLPDEDAVLDPYARLEAFRALAERFEKGGDGGGPLAVSVREARDALKTRVGGYESLAEFHLESARRRMAESRYSDALFHFYELRDPPLSFTRAVVGAHKEILKSLGDIDALLVKESLQRVVWGVQVTHRQGSEFDLDMAFDWNTVEQGENLVTGLARFIPAPEERQVTPGASGTNMVLRLLPDDEGRIVPNRPLALEDPFEGVGEISIAFDLSFRGIAPIFLAVDLDGDQVGALCADPKNFPFQPGTPLISKERKAPEYDFYGRGRGVMFHATDPHAKDPRGMGAFGDPARWKWDDAYFGRHSVGHERETKESDPRAPLQHRFFAFEKRDRPYRVVFSRFERRLRFEVDGQTVWEETRPEFATAPPSGLIQILTYTTCDVDNVLLSGRVSKAWLDAKKADLERRKASAPAPGK